jgi:hypothetical protein
VHPVDHASILAIASSEGSGPDLTDLVSSALRAGGCRGWSVGVYHPDLDSERHDARQIGIFLAVIGQ